MYHAGSTFEEYQVTADFAGTSEEHLSVKAGETVSVLSKDSSGECSSTQCPHVQHTCIGRSYTIAESI